MSSEQVVARTCDRVRAMSVATRGDVCHGEPADDLVQVAEDTGAQLIVPMT